jgi:hypothetical protein
MLNPQYSFSSNKTNAFWLEQNQCFLVYTKALQNGMARVRRRMTTKTITSVHISWAEMPGCWGVTWSPSTATGLWAGDPGSWAWSGVDLGCQSLSPQYLVPSSIEWPSSQRCLPALKEDSRVHLHVKTTHHVTLQRSILFRFLRSIWSEE